MKKIVSAILTAILFVMVCVNSKADKEIKFRDFEWNSTLIEVGMTLFSEVKTEYHGMQPYLMKGKYSGLIPYYGIALEQDKKIGETEYFVSVQLMMVDEIEIAGYNSVINFYGMTDRGYTEEERNAMTQDDFVPIVNEAKLYEGEYFIQYDKENHQSEEIYEDLQQKLSLVYGAEFKEYNMADRIDEKCEHLYSEWIDENGNGIILYAQTMISDKNDGYECVILSYYWGEMDRKLDEIDHNTQQQLVEEKYDLYGL